MSGETIVTYGSITIRHVLTQSIEQTEVLDPSGTDLICHKFVVRVSGLVHGKSSWCQHVIPLAGANPSGQNSTEALVGVRVGLYPRQAFRLSVGNVWVNGEPVGTILLSASPMSDPPDADMSGRDVKNGPHCTRFVVNKVAGGDVYNVDAEFEIHKVECTFDAQAPFNTRGVLSNRWSATDSLDSNRRLTRSYSGTLILASNNYNPSMFRGMLVPPIQARMRREQMQFTVSEDGLQLRYTFVDVQQSQAAPAPASHWELTVTNSCTIARIMRREVSGLLVAPDDDGITTAADLLLLAWYIIGAKLHNKKWGDAGIQIDSAILENITFSEQIGERTALSFSASFQLVEKAQFNNANPGFLVGLYDYVTGIEQDAVPDDNPGLADFSQRLIGFIGQPLRDLLLPESSHPYNPLLNDGGREQDDGNGGILLDGNGQPDIERPYHKGVCELATLFLPYLQSPCNDEHELVSNRNELVYPDTNAAAQNAPQASYPVYAVRQLPAEDSAFYSDAHKTNAYTVWKMSSTIRNRTMRAAMPIAKAQPTSSGSPPEDGTQVVRLGPSQVRRIVRIHAERVGDWPELPDLETLSGFSSTDAGAGYPGPRQHLLTSRATYAVPESAATGQLCFNVGVEAVYALSRAPLPSERIPIGRQIWNRSDEMSTRSKVTASPVWTSGNIGGGGAGDTGGGDAGEE